MSVDVGLELAKVRCAAFHRTSGADPGGSTGSYDAFLCVEVPLPWGRDICEHEPFASFGSGAALVGVDGRRWRPQGLVPRGDTGGLVRVLALESADGPGPYARREWWVELDELAPLCAALLAGDHAELGRFEAAEVVVPESLIDVMVCTHGRRDACCGSSGTVLAEQAAVALADDLAGDRARLWRTSHTGGHRFAPTALSFPDGAAWAHLDVVSLAAVLRRDGQAAEVAAQCRGVASVPGPALQMADRFALSEVGWEWLARPRSVEVVAFDRSTLDTTVRVEGDGFAGEVLVSVSRHVPMPTCGEIDGPEYAVEPEWSARRL